MATIYAYGLTFPLALQKHEGLFSSVIAELEDWEDVMSKSGWHHAAAYMAEEWSNNFEQHCLRHLYRDIVLMIGRLDMGGESAEQEAKRKQMKRDLLSPFRPDSDYYGLEVFKVHIGLMGNHSMHVCGD